MYLYISLYLYISIYIYIYILKKRTQRSAFYYFFCKRTKRTHVLLRSLQKNKTFSAFFDVLCQKMLHSLHSFTFLRKERKRTHRSFGSHNLPKTRKKNDAFFKRTLNNDAFRTEKDAVPNPAFFHFIFCKKRAICSENQ